MTGAWAIVKKDFGSYSRSWVGVLGLSSFLLIAGTFFTLFLLGYSRLSFEAARKSYEGIEGLGPTGFVLGAFLLNLGIIFLFLTPLLAMRSLAEEKRMGTLELLYTFPLSDLEIVLGKYLSLLAQLFFLGLPTLIYAAILRTLGAKVEWGIVCSGLLGFFLLGATFLSAGLFFSSLTENQIISAGVTFLFLLGVWILEWAASFLPNPLGPRVSLLSPFVHYRDFPLGIVDFSDVAYFLVTILFFIFLTHRVVEARNWRG